MPRSAYWRDFYLVDEELRLLTDADVDAAELALGVQLPTGYRELKTTLGDGVICDDLRVFPPPELENAQQLFRELTQEFWFYDEPDEDMTQDYAMESVIVADTGDGDQIILHPKTGQLHVLPRHDERTYAVGTDLSDVVAWFQQHWSPGAAHPLRYFDAFVGSLEARNGRGNRAGLERITTAIRSLSLHDAEDSYDYGYTFFFKAIGGFLSFHDSQVTDVNVHLRYRTNQSPEVRERIRQTAAEAGVSFTPSWSMASTA